MSNADLLIEIGTEELPPKALLSLSRAFEKEVLKGLRDSALSTDSAVTVFATPRRLALAISGVAIKQTDQNIDKQGPLVSAAYDADGKPTPAALGFAKSCGVEITELDTVQSDKGEKLAFSVQQIGQEATRLIPAIITDALSGLPIPKRMRWGAGSAEFVRPVKWVVVLHGSDVIDCEIYGVQSGRISRGHRFHHGGELEFSSADAQAYQSQLQDAFVVASFNERREKISAQVQQVADQLGGQALTDKALLDEVTALVEWPVALAGAFETEFLSVPNEALIYTMKDNQKYFPVVDKSGDLMPHFITVSNIESKDAAQVIAGNERVVRPRLADAAFFWEQDQKKPLESHLDSLAQIVFQKELGTLAEKTERLKKLTPEIALQIGADKAQAQRAAALSKCDLMTDMVGEFPAMQGIAGRYYAEASNEPSAVSTALESYYLPRQAGGDLPQEGVSQALALADRVDTLTGIFGIGQKPTGSKDPFALRRSSLGILRIMIEEQLDIDLHALITTSAKLYGGKLSNDKVVDEAFDYCLERLLAYYQDQGVPTEMIESVRSRRPLKPLDFDKRLRAVQSFNELEAAQSLAAANKRIGNILKKEKGELPVVDTALFSEPAETQLFEALQTLGEEANVSFDNNDYASALTKLSSLKQPVDTFFDDVMVMADDASIRNNRLALLQKMRELFLRVADLSVLKA